MPFSNVIPGSKQRISEREDLFLRHPKNASATDRERMRREHDARMIELIPKHFGGELSGKVFRSAFRNKASLFDFINIFTEHAKFEPPVLKLGDRREGRCARQVIPDNARTV